MNAAAANDNIDDDNNDDNNGHRLMQSNPSFSFFQFTSQE
jgi:hypothetical protein